VRLLILHGWGGSDYPHWQSFLASEIAKDYGTVSFPLIQHPHYPNLNRWSKEVLSHLESFKPDTVVCHSLSNTLWLHLADKNLIPYEIERLFLVAMPSLNTKLDTLSTFYPAPLPKELYAKRVRLITSDNDPYISLKEAKEIAKYYDIPLTILANAGHINADSGYGKWSWIVDLVKEPTRI